MKAVIADNHWVYLENVPPNLEAAIIERLSAKHKRAQYIDIYQQTWDGVYRKYYQKEQKMSRTFLPEVKELCDKFKIPLVVEDLRPPHQLLDGEKIKEDMLPGIKLEDYQIRTLTAVCKNEFGIIKSPTGSGKTELIAAIAKIYGGTTVVIADIRVVIEQIKERLELRDVADDGVGLFYGGSTPTGQKVVVGSIQSLMTPPVSLKRKSPDQYAARLRRAKSFQEIVKRAGLLMVDECVDADSWISTDNGLIKARDLINIKAKVRVGNEFYPIVGHSEKVDEALEVTTATGRRINVSSNHKFAVLRNGKLDDIYACELTVDDYLLSSSIDVEVNQFSDDFRKFYHLGLFIGDGHFLNYKQVKFSVRRDIADWRLAIIDLISVWGGRYSEHLNSRGDTTFRVKSDAFVEFLMKYGFSPGKKTGSIQFDKLIPNYDAAAGFVRGLFDTEGSAYSSYAKLGMSDRAVVELVQVLLSYLGIRSKIIIENKRINPKHADTWRVYVSGYGYSKFSKKVGFGFSRKHARTAHAMHLCGWIDKTVRLADIRMHLGFRIKKPFVNATTRAGSSRYSLSELHQWLTRINALQTDIDNIWKTSKELGLSYTKVGKLVGKSPMTVWRNRFKYTTIAVDIIRKRLNTMINGIYAHYTTERVTSIIPVGKRELIDFTVCEANRFEANGLLVHNCDKASSKLYRNLFKFYFNGRFKFGFSATPFDPDKPIENLILREHVGSIIAEIERKEVQEAGRIIPIKFYMMAIGENENKNDARTFDIAEKEIMIENASFHERIAKIVSAFPEDGTLILVDTSNVEMLGENLEKAIPGSVFIYGKTSKSARNKAIEDFENRRVKCLIGGKILKRGLDLRGGAENLIMIGGGKLWSNFDQKIGRAVRKNARGWARVFSFYFMNNKYLYMHSRKQLKSLVEMGYYSEVVFKDTRITGEELINARFRVPKKGKHAR